ncbi:MAG: hypothetical protein ACF8NJ_01875, partial [Phycisphaerales bacterium JB038]
MLIYAGIDEAGYGPMLGPLCVGCAVFAVDDWQEGEAAPDLWERLAAGVCLQRKGAGRRVVIADSKKLKLHNSSKTKHPLVHLERGLAACLGELPATDAALFEQLGVELAGAPWHGGEAIDLPVGNEPDLLRIAANNLRHVFEEAGVSLLDLRCLALSAARLNESFDETHSKATTSFHLVMQHIAAIWDAHPEAHPRIVIDRQGGRAHYGKALGELLPGSTIEVVAESPEVARYHLRRDGRELTLSFSTQAEDRHLPVALASMAAKYVRELAMARFNRYFQAQLPGLKPTAGYVQDARRWLREAA